MQSNSFQVINSTSRGGNVNKLAFLTMTAPPSYVGGLGRGASGFTTRSDIGPARDQGPSEDAAASGRGEEITADPDQFKDPDEETNIFAGTVYEQDDEEADRIWESVDERIDQRRKARREAAEEEQLKAHRLAQPKIQTQFADLKRGLTAVTDSEWENLPEVANMTGKKQKRNPRFDREYAVPDSVTLTNMASNATEGQLSEEQMAGASESGAMTNLVEIGNARDKVLSLKLDQMSADTSNGSSTTVDPKGYLTDLNSMVVQSDAQIGDIKRARALLDSVIKTNPKHAPGWIAAAALEVHAKKMVAARKIIAKGCEMCPKSEDVWLQAAELNIPENAKRILANAVRELPQSVKIWLKAAVLETDVNRRKNVLRKAVETIPNSVTLWKETVNLETDPADARILLARAVEFVPTSVDLWLTLARLETPQAAQKVLNKARKTIPTSHEIWIAAARLTEQTGDVSKVEGIMASGVAKLADQQVMMDREAWLREAERCESEGSPITARAIVKATLHIDVEEDQRMKIWMDDADSSAARGHIETSRAVRAYLINVFPDRRQVWWTAAQFEKAHGTYDDLQALLAKSVQHCPRAEVLWLMAAKEKWLHGDVPGARNILANAFQANPESEQIWLAAAKLEAENGALNRAKELLANARQEAGTDKIWMKSAVLERQQGALDEALSTLGQGIEKFPTFDKLYMIKGQIYTATQQLPLARETYSKGVKACPNSIPLWLLSSRLEEHAGVVIKARSLLEKARLLNPKNPELWEESVRVEERAGSIAQSKVVLSRGIQECPTSGRLWAINIWNEPRQQRKTRAADALKKTNDDPVIITLVARLFWTDRKIERARHWFGRAVEANKDLGDSWGWWYKFEMEHGEMERRQHVIDLCTAASPKHSPVWQSIAKDLSNQGRSTEEILKLVALALE
ncbi:pre-mrna splicing factor prp1 [Phaffia rhodozyma]|uniref:Pre-mrna splicing factor prp1 n=1 Tax=Phaffia rhodozyma TaxID=264483 RepID=A0A0F7SP23_PHARH|nr:pre-mrna splicing factor prp1 [Phaffia rhodozyma]